MGRTGKWFGYQHWNADPDIMTLAKAFAGGVAGAALLARPEVAARLKPGTHAATFGGNPIACRAALATIEMIDEEGLLARATQIGAFFRKRLDALKAKCPIIREVRVLGAMIGVELAVEGSAFVNRCLERRLLINCTHGTVLRLLPALTISDEQMEEGCDILEEAISA
jgi:acetylornithine/succinyldiaminopimelate/putrescine aminotransferase